MHPGNSRASAGQDPRLQLCFARLGGHRPAAARLAWSRRSTRPSRTGCSTARQQCKPLVAYAAVGQAAGQSFQDAAAAAGPGWWLAVVGCATVLFLAAAASLLALMLRPLLRSFQETAAAFKQAADQIRQTSTAFERALLVVELDVPSSVSAFERVCSELESVVRIMNFVTGNIGRKKGKNPALLSSNSKSRSSRTADAEALADEMRHMSIQRVIKSLTTMTNALPPALLLWRGRMDRLSHAFERATHQGQPSSADKPPEEHPIVARWHEALQEGKATTATGPAAASQNMQEAQDKTVRALANGARQFLGDVQKSMEEADAEDLAGPRDHDTAGPVPHSSDPEPRSSDAAAAVKGSMSHVDKPAEHSATSSSGNRPPRQPPAPKGAGATSGAQPGPDKQGHQQANLRDDRHVELSAEEGKLLEQLLGQSEAPAAILAAIRKVQDATAAAASATDDLKAALQQAHAPS